MHALVERRRAFERCLTRPTIKAFLQKSFESGAGVGIFATCPACGYPAYRLRSHYEICSICGWEDDGQDDAEFSPYPNHSEPDAVAGGPNWDYSLTEARLNFAKNGHMYRVSDTRMCGTMADDCRLRESLKSHFDSLLPAVTEQAFLSAYPQINAAFHSIAEALSERMRKRNIQIHAERKKRYWKAFDILARRLSTTWEGRPLSFEAKMKSGSRLLGITACKVFLSSVQRDFHHFLLTTLERAHATSSFDASDYERWLVIVDDTTPPVLDAYRAAYHDLTSSFKKVFVALPDGQLEEISD